MFDVTKFELDKFLVPIWDKEICFAEAAFVRENEQGCIDPIKLLYPIEKIISVRSTDLNTLYVEGRDYTVNNGDLHIIRGGAIPVLSYNEYYFDLSDEEHAQNRLTTKFPSCKCRGKGFIRAEIGKDSEGMSHWTLSVTYTHARFDTVRPPLSKSDVFSNFISKLEQGKDVSIVATGDSITDGWSASGKTGVNRPPYCPQYNLLFEQYIEARYGVSVHQKNVGVSGSNTVGGLTKLDEICEEEPDLVIIAFGMNDGCGMEPAEYVSNINLMVSTIAGRCPDTSVVVIGSCLPNEELAWSPGGGSILNYHIEYIDALRKAESGWKNAAHADVTTVNLDMLKRKVYQDLAGSNSNHPNDYMHRVYAQVLIKTVFGG